MHSARNFQTLVKIASVLTFAFFVFFVPPNIAAQKSGHNTQIVYEKINPDSLTGYPIKRIIEKLEEVIINFVNPDQKVSFMTKLSNVRLAELKYVVDKNGLAYLETSSSRYVTQVGLILEELDKNKKDASFVASNLGTQMVVLESIKDKFPAQTAQWLLVQQALETSKVALSRTTELSR